MIDFSLEVDAIIGHPRCRWWDDPAKGAALAAIHGEVVGEGIVNKHGVFRGECIEIEHKENRSFCSATIHLAQTKKRHWLMSAGAQIHFHGWGSMPSISDRQGWATRDEALDAALKYLRKRCDDHVDGTESHSAGEAEWGRKLKAELDAFELQAKQLALF